MSRVLVQLLLFLLPWQARRRALVWIFGYGIAPSARIGFSLVVPKSLTLGEKARIGHLTVIRGMNSVTLGEHASIGSLNWIYAIPQGNEVLGALDRSPELVLEEGATITRRHIVDCSDRVSLGRLALVAGYRSQILTHSVNLVTGKQRVKPVKVEEACFVGSGCILLAGSRLPHHSALVAGSTLRHAYDIPYRIYSGVIAMEVGEIAETARFFSRPIDAAANLNA